MLAPGPAPAVPADPADPAPAPAPPVCHAADAYITPEFRAWAVGPGLAGAELHWSATLLALVTLNCFAAPAAAVDPELEFIPELAPLAEVEPLEEAPAPLWSGEAVVPDAASVLFPAPVAFPVNCTSLPTSVRMLSRFPVSL